MSEHEENIKANKYSVSELIALEDNGEINLNQLRLRGIIDSESYNEVNKTRALNSLNDNSLTLDEKWDIIDQYGLSVEELHSMQILNSEEFEMMKPLLPIPIPSSVWEEASPVQPNRTDVFAVGGVSSGKTCFLAGLLEYGSMSANIIIDYNINKGGVIYEEILRQGIEDGKLFGSTPTDIVQYICAHVNNDKERTKSPINIFDMSGEIFQFCFAKSKTEIEALYPNFIQYLFNDNPKVFFLALNWKMPRIPMVDTNEEEYNVSQSGFLDHILEFLVHHGLINKTKAICILVTQWDEYSNPTNEGLDEFIVFNYARLFKRCEEYEARYNIKFEVLPFSLGTFDRRNKYVFDPSYSKTIMGFLNRSLPFIKETKKGWTEKIFGSE